MVPEISQSYARNQKKTEIMLEVNERKEDSASKKSRVRNGSEVRDVGSCSSGNSEVHSERRVKGRKEFYMALRESPGLGEKAMVEAE